MLLQVFLTLLVSAAIGLALWSHRTWFKQPVSWKMLLGGLLTTALLVPALFVASWSLVKSDKLSYNEFWNGYETQAIWNKTTCTEDGSCQRTYDCHPYQVATYSTDDKGNTTVSYHTEYHHCPYATEEWEFQIKTTLGDYEIASANLPTQPVAWDTGTAIPNLPSGIPPFWAAAKTRIDAGQPGPVTKRMAYDNYILASDTTILKQYSDQIADLKAHNLLPSVTHDVHDFYHANKVYFVGYSPSADWQTPTEYLDSAFGTELQGDLHLVIVQANVNPDAYILALKAYWADSSVFGDDTISKNGVIVALGTDGTTVTWARAITGMPGGNEYLLNDIKSKLAGVVLTPEAIVGNVGGQFYVKGGKTKVQAVHGSGVLDRLLWGLDNPADKFARVSMSGVGAGKNGSGYLYLADEIEPSPAQQNVIWLIAVLLVAVVWFAAVKIEENEDEDESGYYDYR